MSDVSVNPFAGLPLLGGLRLVACEWMVTSAPAPNRPRVKKKNKRATRRYWARRPKFLQVPDDRVLQFGDALHMHPALIERLKRQPDERPQEPAPTHAVRNLSTTADVGRRFCLPPLQQLAILPMPVVPFPSSIALHSMF